MTHFRLLRDPETYVAHDWDLLKDAPARQHWLDHFEKHFAETLRHASAQYGRAATGRIETARQQFAQAIERLRRQPDSLPGGKLDIIELDRLRGAILRACKLNDPFGGIKDRENARAVKLYLDVVRRLHALPADRKWLHLVECVFAGNIFDLGAMPTLHMATEPADFWQLIKQVKPRPWLVDDFDRLAADLAGAPPTKWAKAVVFADNAGSDFILGLMPLVRELALGGTHIVLAANEQPSLNDITVYEAIDVVEQLAGLDQDLVALIEARVFEVVSSGSGLPLIDLSEVSDELNAAAEGAELVIIEGMGRAVESNLDAAFSVDCLRLAILKDAAVATRIGGELYDCICKYTPAPA